MVKSIQIQNFRCFEDFQLDGFGRVNLIGGMNNSGKTALVEALCLMGGTPYVITELKQFRNFDLKVFEKESESSVWDEFFFNKNRTKTIDIKTEFTSGLNYQETYVIGGEDYLSKENLFISYFNNNEKFLSLEINVSNGSPEFNNKYYDKSLEISRNGHVFFLRTNPLRKGRQDLIRNYSQLELDGQVEYMLEGFKSIDSTIEEVKIISLGEPNLYIRRKGESLMPMDLFGDAITKMAKIITYLIECKNGILLIDEIENGIHYTNQPKVWELIFKLANKFNVQIFATTHSKEMIQAFNKVALEGGFEDDAKYIEMARHYKTKRIIGTVLETNILKHKLDYNKAFRGE
jgi:AAA15 family ATPase/GTPase